MTRTFDVTLRVDITDDAGDERDPASESAHAIGEVAVAAVAERWPSTRPELIVREVLS